MVCVDSTVGAKVMPGHLCVELVSLARFFALDYFDARQYNLGNDGTLPAAN